MGLMKEVAIEIENSKALQYLEHKITQLEKKVFPEKHQPTELELIQKYGFTKEELNLSAKELLDMDIL